MNCERSIIKELETVLYCTGIAMIVAGVITLIAELF